MHCRSNLSEILCRQQVGTLLWRVECLEGRGLGLKDGGWVKSKLKLHI